MTMLTLINADEDDEAEITDPVEVAELFAAFVETAPRCNRRAELTG